MFQLAYCAGHYLNTPGKRTLKSLDKNQTKEWVLNDRIARYLEKAAEAYEVKLLRTDDETGKSFIDIPDRTKKANRWGADVYLDIHHNAGIGGKSGGGVEAFCYPGSAKGKQYRDTIYAEVIAAGGLKGNRSQPLKEKAFDSLALTDMPAVLVEYGFMDSQTDTPVILSQDYAKKVAYATMKAIAKVAGIPKKVKTDESLSDFVRQVQKAIGAAVDGIAGPETLGKTVTLSAQRNDTHPAVKVVQKRLYALGYQQVGEADGIAGPKFTAAVKAYQRDNGCWVDGEITAGNKTWKKLLSL
ncbi:MAG: N-acetylmuramoyl-L-alanine amidase [Oscillospiraceae bacterium]|nr:N-acetylmuramoyl-L-alanine amidase [Oscillospiraceae bacterium]